MRAPPTPSSLKWLIDRRARLAGELAKLQACKGRPLTKAIRLVANLEKRFEEARHAHSVALFALWRLVHPATEVQCLAAEGFLFFRSDNNVWLTDHVPPAYLCVVEAGSLG